MGKNFYKTCDDLKRELGLQEALEIINYLEPKLQERQKQFIQILRTKNSTEISHYAHKTKGSITYYGTQSLNDLLEQIINLEYVNDVLINDLINSINLEFNIILHYWKNSTNK